ncbi:hypothetical protein F5B20DRAFT_478771 [Whalleya microplaca]|nr:hypothetical protein F5B20DRAFT_478771 [Whalleya microplaca]
MSIDIHEVSPENIVRLTRLLSRRPEYGIAVPSRRWLTRQEDKLKSCPNELLFTPSPLKRFVTKIVDTIDPEAVDPRALLCKTHASLNPFLLRRLFMAVAYEATVHSDALRSWEGRKRLPSIAAFVERLDAIAALWTHPDVYSKCYGGPPFDGHMIFVQSGCEACILSAVGASANVLADLRAMVIDRTERCPPRSGRDGRRIKKPRIARVIEAWIDHLREERAAECRALSDDILADLRAIRPEVVNWQREMKKQRHGRRASKRAVYTELKRSSSGGHKLKDVPSGAPRKRRTKHGIPVAMTDREGAEAQRIAAICAPAADAKSIYRPDSICDSQVAWKQNAYYYDDDDDDDDHNNRRPGAPEPTPGSGPSQGRPTQSFIDRFEREVAVDDYDPYEDDYVEEQAAFEERDFEQEERSRGKVADWYSERLTADDGNHNNNNHGSVLSVMHPAFQPTATTTTTTTTTAFSNVSAMPQPLRFKKDREPSATANPRKQSRADSAWTDATVYTVNPSIVAGGADDAPPVPRVPSRYTRDVDDGEKTPTGPRSQTPRARPPGRRGSTDPFPEYADPFNHQHERRGSATPTPSTHRGKNSSSREKHHHQPLNWPAPQPTNRKKYLFQDSDVGSRLSTHDRDRRYLRERGGMQAFAREENPFVNRSPFQGQRRTPAGGGEEVSDGNAKTPTPTPTQTLNQNQNQNQGEYYRRQSASSRRRSTSSSVYSQNSSRGSVASANHRTNNTGSTTASSSSSSSHHHAGNNSSSRGEPLVPRPSTAQAEKEWRARWGVRDDEAEEDPVRPDDSASNVQWLHRPSDDVTDLGAFIRKGMRG